MRLTLVEWHFLSNNTGSLTTNLAAPQRCGSSPELPGDLRPAPAAAFVSVREIRRDTAGDTGDAVPRCRLTVMHKYAWTDVGTEMFRCEKGLCGQTHKRKSNITTVSRTKSTKYRCHQAAVVFTASSVWQQPLSCQDFPHVANTRFRLNCLFKVC